MAMRSLQSLEWAVVCLQCGELERAPNGEIIAAGAERHKRQNQRHHVYVGYEVKQKSEVIKHV